MAKSRRYFVLIVALCSWATVADAQTDCAPPTTPVISWLGRTTGCSRYSLVKCDLGEIVEFAPFPFFGNQFQPCDRFEWDFGDGERSFVARPEHKFTNDTTNVFFVRLLVYNGSGFARGDVIIQTSNGVPTKVPIIVEFKATPARISSGQSVVFTWVVHGAPAVRIDPLNITVDASLGTLTFRPFFTQRYTLVALGDAAMSSSLPVTVTVDRTRRRSSTH